jgi:hypothetical protein
MPYGLLGLIVLALDIYVIYLIATSNADPGMKLVWIIVVLLLPAVGPALYLLFGRGNR